MIQFFRWIEKSALRWQHDQRASVILIFALCIGVFGVLLGMGIDFGTAVLARSKALTAADAAALRALEVVRQQVSAAGKTFDQAKVLGESAGVRAFNAQLGNTSIANVTSATVSVTKDPLTAKISASVSFNGFTTTSFMKLMGIPQQKIAANVQASSHLPLHVHLTFLVDTSQSMAIGGDTSTLSQINSDSNMRCTFACHDSNADFQYEQFWTPPGQVKPTANTWLYLRCSGAGGVSTSSTAKLRIDYLRDAMTKILNMGANSSNLYTASIVTYGTPSYPTVLPSRVRQDACPFASKKISYYAYDLTAPSPSALVGQPISTVQAMVPMIDIEDNSDMIGSFPTIPKRTNVVKGLTQTTSNLRWMASNLPTSGNGLSSSSPVEVLIFVTDATESIFDSSTVTEHDQLFSTSPCDDIKTKGILLVTLYTTYINIDVYPGPLMNQYAKWVADIGGKLAPTMDACASPGLSGTATQGSDVVSTMTNLFANLDRSLVIGLNK